MKKEKYYWIIFYMINIINNESTQRIEIAIQLIDPKEIYCPFLKLLWQPRCVPAVAAAVYFSISSSSWTVSDKWTKLSSTPASTIMVGAATTLSSMQSEGWRGKKRNNVFVLFLSSPIIYEVYFRFCKVINQLFSDILWRRPETKKKLEIQTTFIRLEPWGFLALVKNLIIWWKGDKKYIYCFVKTYLVQWVKDGIFLIFCA